MQTTRQEQDSSIRTGIAALHARVCWRDEHLGSAPFYN
jgi:hypothetical protein